MTFNPWQFLNPYIPYTTIRAEEVNPNFQGLSVSLRYVADELNGFRPRLPNNFTGNVAIPDQPVANTLLGIDEQGNMALVSQAAFALNATKELSIKTHVAQTLTVDGNNHADWFNMTFTGATEADVITVAVGEAVADTEAGPGVAVGSVIFFNQATDTPLTFAELPGVTIRSPGLLKAAGRNSTVALIAETQTQWVLCGDVYLGEQVVD